MSRLRIAIATLAGIAVVLGGVVFCLQTRRALIAQFQQAVRDPANAEHVSSETRDAADRGELPAGLGIEIPEPLMWRLDLSDLLAAFWPVWIVLVFATTFGLAFLLPDKWR